MADYMDKIITAGMVIMGLIALWAVLTSNALFIG